MTQPDLFTSLPPARPRKRGHVVRTSVLAYQERHRNGRVDAVLAYIGLTRSHMQLGAPTSAEIAYVMGSTSTDRKLYVRRGLSDALAAGLVCHAGERKCAVSGRTCVTWRVCSR